MTTVPDAPLSHRGTAAGPQQERVPVVAVIPARGGSKGIPHKNIAPLAGKPLLAYSVEVARAARLVDRVVVSTDDPEIAAVATRYGAEVPFLRPAGISGDTALVSDALNYTLERLYPRPGDRHIALLLYPTSPFRTPGLLDHLLGKILEGFSSVITVRKIPAGRDPLLALGPHGSLQALRPARTGDAVPGAVFYRPYGLLSIQRNYGRFKPFVHVIQDQISFLDIDEPADLRLAEEIIRRGLFQFFPGAGPCSH